jgi:hypothetical protein
MSNNSCDLVFNINQIFPNIINAINGKEFSGFKIKKGKIENILNENIGDGIVLIFSKNNIIDIFYKKNTSLFLKKLKDLLIDDVFFIVIYDIENKNIKHTETIYQMIYNYLNLILDNCE